MDRLTGYGYVVRMNNTMSNTLENRRKYVQFIKQEIKRFRLPDFTREACKAIVDEGRKRSGWRNTLTNRFRPMISIIFTSGILAWDEGKIAVELRHVNDAIQKHCKTIQRQILEKQMEQHGQLLEIKPEGAKLGQVYGLAVVTARNGERVGTIGRVTGSMRIKEKTIGGDKPTTRGWFKVTGIAKEPKWIDDSVSNVQTNILNRYNEDISQTRFVHIDFAQSQGVDGPSAGITMTVLLCSLMDGKPVRQDVAMTGAMDIGPEDGGRVNAVGGVHEKIMAAQTWGFKKVLIPKKNYRLSIDPTDYKIEVVGCETLDDYLKHLLVDRSPDPRIHYMIEGKTAQ